nr:hypothetical protein [Massilia sp. Se16.2.3]
MNNIPNPPGRAQHHPLLLLAALAVVLFCLIGTAAIMGWIPSSIGGNASRQLNEADRAALAASMPGAQAAVAPVAPDVGMVRQPVGGAYPASPAYPAVPAAPAYPAQQVAQAYAPAPSAPAHAPVRESEPEPAPHTVVRSKPVQVAAAEPKWCGNCGNIESVRAIKQRARGSGLGAAGAR